jgi:hypothetical protein
MKAVKLPATGATFHVRASVAQTPAFGVCGSYLISRLRIRGQTLIFETRGISAAPMNRGTVDSDS